MVAAVRVCPQCRSVYCTDVWSCNLDGERLIDRVEDPLVGGAVDRYRVLEVLGEGAMGRVYRARHAVLDRNYAIKVLYGDYAGDPKFQERFRREAQSISRIRHPNIVSVEDFGATQHGLTFLVLELVEGPSLETIVARGPLEPARVIAIARKVAAGLSAVHAHGFVHRDVKPSNVMLDDEDGGEQVKLLDFGTVSLLAVPRDQRLTRMGHIIGTPTYMAPEQSQDPGVGPTADLYALGVVMYEMLTGRPPFEGATRAEVLIQHITDPPPSLPMMGGLETVVARLLEKDPSDRPQSAEALVELLDRLETHPRKLTFSNRGEEPPLEESFPALEDPDPDVVDWGDWAREATIEPYAPSALSSGGPGWGDDPWTSDPERISTDGLDGDAVRRALAKDLTIDEAALIYEPAIPEESKVEAARGVGDDGATQVDFELEDERVSAEARTELDFPPEEASSPLEELEPPEPLPTLAGAPPPESPLPSRPSSGAALPLEPPVEITRDAPDPMRQDRAPFEERARAADPATDPLVEAAASEHAPPRLPSSNLLHPPQPRSSIVSGEGDEVYEDEAPTRASSSGPIPVVPVSLTGEDGEISSGGGGALPPLAELGLGARPQGGEARRGEAHGGEARGGEARAHRAGGRAEPRPPNRLVGLDDESTASVRRRRPHAPVKVRVDHRGRLERLLLPVTVLLLLAAAAALAGALILRERADRREIEERPAPRESERSP